MYGQNIVDKDVSNFNKVLVISSVLNYFNHEKI